MLDSKENKLWNPVNTPLHEHLKATSKLTIIKTGTQLTMKPEIPDKLPRLIPWKQLGFLFLRILLEYSRGSTSPAIPFNGNYLCFLSLLFNRLPSASCGSDGPVRIPDAGLP